MPIYEMECSKCGLVSDHLLDIEETDVEVACPGCGCAINRKNNRYYSGPPSVIGCKSTDVNR